ncbi:MAG: M56 family peptidase [Bacteroidia bacterium]|nr:MAG: M56 family peptidase [Bacteroidia bacterium]
MEQLSLWLFWSSLYLIIVGIAYYSFLRKQLSPGHGRIFILSGLFIAILLGACSFISFPQDVTAISSPTVLLPEVVVMASSGAETVRHELTSVFVSSRILFFISLTVSALLSIRVAVSLILLLFRIKFNRRLNIGGSNVLPVSGDISPCSFFSFVFVPESLLDKPVLNTILVHERAHIIKGHSVDLIFIELLTIVFWFHPVLWLLRKELKTLQEYEADRYVLNQNVDKQSYQKLLLDISLSGMRIPITNPLNYSSLKKRIMMMNKKVRKNSRWSITTMLMVIPLMGMVLMLQAIDPQSQRVRIPSETQEQNNARSAYDEDVIFTIVEQLPSFPGGTDAKLHFLQSKLRYPAEAREAGIQGTVFVTFVVENDGEISDVRVLRGIGGGCDEEAVRVVEKMPAWEPGVQRGEKVRVQFNLPIRFKLNGDNNKESQNREDGDQTTGVMIILDGEKIGLVRGMDLNTFIPVEQIGHVEVLTGEKAAEYGYERVIKITRKERE